MLLHWLATSEVLRAIQLLLNAIHKCTQATMMIMFQNMLPWFTERQNDIYIGYSVITHMDHSESSDKCVDFRTPYQVKFQYKRYQSASLIVITTMYWVWVCSELYDSQNDIYIWYSVITHMDHSESTDKRDDFRTLYQVRFQYKRSQSASLIVITTMYWVWVCSELYDSHNDRMTYISGIVSSRIWIIEKVRTNVMISEHCTK